MKRGALAGALRSVIEDHISFDPDATALEQDVERVMTEWARQIFYENESDPGRFNNPSVLIAEIFRWLNVEPFDAECALCSQPVGAHETFYKAPGILKEGQVICQKCRMRFISQAAPIQKVEAGSTFRGPDAPPTYDDFRDTDVSDPGALDILDGAMGYLKRAASKDPEIGQRVLTGRYNRPDGAYFWFLHLGETIRVHLSIDERKKKR